MCGDDWGTFPELYKQESLEGKKWFFFCYFPQTSEESVLIPVPKTNSKNQASHHLHTDDTNASENVFSVINVKLFFNVLGRPLEMQNKGQSLCAAGPSKSILACWSFSPVSQTSSHDVRQLLKTCLSPKVSPSQPRQRQSFHLLRVFYLCETRLSAHHLTSLLEKVSTLNS